MKSKKEKHEMKEWKFVSMSDDGTVKPLPAPDKRPSLRSIRIVPWVGRAIRRGTIYLVQKAVDEIVSKPIEYGVKYSFMAVGAWWVTFHAVPPVAKAVAAAVAPPPVAVAAPAPVPVAVIAPPAAPPAPKMLPEPTNVVTHVSDPTKTYDLSEDIAPYFDKLLPVSNLTLHGVHLGDTIGSAEKNLKERNVPYRSTDRELILEGADAGTVLNFDASSHTLFRIGIFLSYDAKLVKDARSYLMTHTLRNQWLWSQSADGGDDIYDDAPNSKRHIQMSRQYRSVYEFTLNA